ncbi:NACHT domain-containing protein [Actinoplanes sp. NPDC051633]|uniref:NACHT domain-containing protein n=1 Tax=Actinoplanes sp. NPDC051633 TaxID=3155670 RepID=UPI003432A354
MTPATVLRLAEAADRLARAVHAQWAAEEGQRRFRDPFPLAVRWANANEHLVDHWPNIRRAAASAGQEPLDLGGQLNQVVDVYRRVPSGRLVVLGDAGSGKTILAIRFVLDMLEQRHSDGAVPVIVDLGGWDQTRLSVGKWIVRQLTLTYPGLPAPATLLDSGMTLPVLDGFDEIAAGFHPAALKSLSATNMPLLLTSRPENTPRQSMPVTSLPPRPLSSYVADCRRPCCLPATLDPQDQQLRTGHDEVGLSPGVDQQSIRTPGASAVRETLSTPLMVSLARTVYSDDRTADPVELLDTTRFTASTDVEAYLLDAFLHTAYDHGPRRESCYWCHRHLAGCQSAD